MSSEILIRLFAGLLSVAMVCPDLLAQGSAQISGTVRDQSGAVLPGVELTATQTDTGLMRTSVSNETGSYVFANLAVGPYRIEASLPGFRTYVQSGIVLQVNGNIVVNPSLEVGQVNEQVEVQANAALVETRNSGIGQVIENERILDLPLNGRQVTDLIYLAGAAVFVRNAGSASMPQGVGISVGGGAGTGVTYTLDGALHSNPFDGLNLAMPFPDALQEFKVETGALSAQSGMHSGGTVSGVTKAGTNEFHGDLFEFVRNGVFNARNFFALRRDSLKRNQFGGIVGGPVKSNKLFFFGGLQTTITRSDPASSIAFVPTAATLAGDFTAFASPACNAGRTITLRAPFVNSRVDPSSYSKAALNFASKLPQSADPCGRITYGAITQIKENQAVGRIDYQQSPRHLLFGRYLVTIVHQPVPYAIDPAKNLLTSNATGQDKLGQSFTLGSTYLFSSNVVNSFRMAVNRTAVGRLGAEYFSPRDVGIDMFSYRPKYTNVNITGGFALGTVGQDRFNTTAYQVNDDVNFVRGNHQLAFGTNLAQWRSNQNANDRDHTIAFNAQTTGLGMADFLTGRVSTLNQAAPSILHMSQWYFGVYANDTWKLTPRVTLNYGVRWEPYLPQTITDGRIYHFDYAAFQAGTKSTVFKNAPAGLAYAGDPGFPGKSGINKNWLNVGPRIGLGWDVKGDGKTSVRASWGYLYDYAPAAQFLFITTGPPFGGQVTVNNPPGGLDSPYLGYPGGNPFPLPPINVNTSFPASSGYSYFNYDTKRPAVSSWNLTVQRQVASEWLVSASYLGSNTVHQWVPREINPAIYLGTGPCALNGVTYSPCSATSNTNQRRRFSLERPQDGQLIGFMALVDDGSTSNYQGLLLSVQRRANRSLSVSGNYTWSHCIDDGAGYLRVGGNGDSIVNPLNRKADRGNCNALLADRRHLVNFTAVWDTPQFSNTNLRAIATGWKVSGVTKITSGAPLTVTIGQDIALTGISNQRPNQVLENVYGDKSITNYLNPRAFAAPPAGLLGNLGRGTVYGPKVWQFDMSISRAFQVLEKQRLELRAEAFNVLNSTQFGNPQTNLSSNTFGQITATAIDPRIMQFALKYVF
jgi:Carboxypeptidase regulatory-like domain